MWNKNWREEIWQNLDQPWDIVVVGGGITGAGILREATRLGLKTLLVEQRDFAFGTSSRSSKLVHGGLRYLKQGKIRADAGQRAGAAAAANPRRGWWTRWAFCWPTKKAAASGGKNGLSAPGCRFTIWWRCNGAIATTARRRCGCWPRA
ncbi:MAG: FAD-dependent oxidoreductase [Chloroflexota bacterium]